MRAISILLVLLLLILSRSLSIATNVLYIVVDDLRPDIASYRMVNEAAPHTPNLDRLAQRGVLFEQAHVQQAVCGPSRNSFMSGRRPDSTSVWNFIDDFRGSCMGNVSVKCRGFGGNRSWSALPQHFRRHGWRTAGAGKIFQPGAPPENDQAFSWTEPYVYRDIDRCSPANTSGVTRQVDFCDQPISDCVDTWLTNATLRNLRDAAAGDRPWFVGVGYHKPHPPWPVPAEFTRLHDNLSAIPLAAQRTLSEGAPHLAFYSARDLNVAEEFAGNNITIRKDRAVPDLLARRLRQAYYGAVAFLDYNIGRLLLELQVLGVEQQTMVVVHGDHGWNLGEHGMWGKQALWDTTTRVPLIISTPWLPHTFGRRIGGEAGFFEMVDLFDTVTELAGLPLPPDANDGTSAAAAAFGKDVDAAEAGLKRAAYSQYPRCAVSLVNTSYDEQNPCTVGPMAQRDRFQWMGYSIRTVDWRFTVWLAWNGALQQANWSSVAARELYDHRIRRGGGGVGNADGVDVSNGISDSQSFDTERVNVVETHADVAARLQSRLFRAWQEWNGVGGGGGEGS